MKNIFETLSNWKYLDRSVMSFWTEFFYNISLFLLVVIRLVILASLGIGYVAVVIYLIPSYPINVVIAIVTLLIVAITYRYTSIDRERR